MAIARSRSETASAALAEQHDRADRLAAVRRSARRSPSCSGQSRPSQPCFQPTGRRETRRSIIASTAPGGAGRPAPWWSAPRPTCASTRSRSHDRDRGVAEPLARLVGERPARWRASKPPRSGAAHGLERLEDRRGGRLAERHDPPERRAHEPHPGDERERRERHDRARTRAARCPASCSMRRHDEQRAPPGSRPSAAAISSGPRISCQRRPTRAAASRRPVETKTKPSLLRSGVAHVLRDPCPGLRSASQLGQRARVGDVVARSPRRGAP